MKLTKSYVGKTAWISALLGKSCGFLLNSPIFVHWPFFCISLYSLHGYQIYLWSAKTWEVGGTTTPGAFNWDGCTARSKRDFLEVLLRGCSATVWILGLPSGPMTIVGFGMEDAFSNICNCNWALRSFSSKICNCNCAFRSTSSSVFLGGDRGGEILVRLFFGSSSANC